MARLIDFILTTFNSFHSRLQFTLEIGGNSINFSDVNIINNNNYLELNNITNQHSQDLNYLSSHPISHKKDNGS